MGFVEALDCFVQSRLLREEKSDLVYGTVSGSGVLLDEMQIEADMDMVDVPLGLQRVEAKISGKISGEHLVVKGASVTEIEFVDAPIVMVRGLMPGDRVMMVRKQDGQRYSVIDRIG